MPELLQEIYNQGSLCALFQSLNKITKHAVIGLNFQCLSVTYTIGNRQTIDFLIDNLS